MSAFIHRRALPCAIFFAEGQIFKGLAALLMQISLILWPLAARWAERSAESFGVEKLLAELAQAHRAPVDPYAPPAKKFRHIA